MASVLGKRKAPSSAKATTSATKKSGKITSRKPAATSVAAKKKAVKEDEQKKDDSAIADAQDIFRRHFEAAFKPLPETKRKTKKAKVVVESDDDEDEEEEEEDEDDTDGDEDEDPDEDVGADGEEAGEEWDGLSGDGTSIVQHSMEDDSGEDEDDTPVVEVVDHSSNKPLPVSSMSKRELKAFMSSKPPSQTDPKPTPITLPGDAGSDDENDKSMLANDLALQRLLSESHLLSRHTITPFSNPTAASKTFSEGRLRQRQLDLRAQNLAPGVKSLFKQEKMPMAFRKGINAAAADRETKRRRQAKENGIVLEREAAPKKAKRARADRGVDGPAVGRMKGAELKLSERDIRSIEGPGSGGRGGMRGGRGGGGRGRGRR
ncbi:uncharacterized protein CTRU02_212846 [Colletotrichum truncatum]|uniref:Uncharacterized protein n=1 Tax=Colletotrichum truncatum TaxID=5467 RepID=A0ACC3YJ00_COLTU